MRKKDRFYGEKVSWNMKYSLKYEFFVCTKYMLSVSIGQARPSCSYGGNSINQNGKHTFVSLLDSDPTTDVSKEELLFYSHEMWLWGY